MKSLLILFSLCGAMAQASTSLFDRTIEGSSNKLFDVLVSNGAPQRELRSAFEYFDSHSSQIGNKKNLILVDFGQALADQRFLVLDLKNGKIKKSVVSHGYGSDPELSGHAVRFSNVRGSNSSSLGYYLTLEPYTGKFGYSLRIKGLTAGQNTNVQDRTVIIHAFGIGAAYDQEACKAKHRREKHPDLQRTCLRDGELTQGCFGLPKSFVAPLVDQIAGGTLMYAFH